MTDHIRIKPTPGIWVIRAGAVELGRSDGVLELVEGGGAPVLYVPRADVDMAAFVKTERSSRCPWKGLCSYYTVALGDAVPNGVWSYEAPIAGMEAIAGHLAFYSDRGCTVTPA